MRWPFNHEVIGDSVYLCTNIGLCSLGKPLDDEGAAVSEALIWKRETQSRNPK